MTVDPNSLTMAQYALIANNPQVEAVTFSLIDNGSVLARDIPFVTDPTMVVNGSRVEGNLPTVNWAKLNSEPVAGVVTPKPYQEVVYIIRDSVDVDKYMVLDKNRITDPRELNANAHLKAIAYDFNDKWINNDHVAGNSEALVGLKYRIANGSTYGVRPENLIDAGGVDLTMATLTTSTSKDKGNQFLELLDQLLWSVDAPDGSPSVVLYMNDVMKRRFRTAMRALGTDGGFATTTDGFGRSMDTYKDSPVYDIGYKADQSTKIVAGNGLTGASAVGELATGVNSTGASALFTSIYAVNYGFGHMRGWQFAPVAINDIGLLNNGVIYRMVIDWAGGVVNDSNRSIARMFDIKIGG